MTENQAEIFIELWDSVKNYIPQKERNLAAEQYVSTFVDLGFDVEQHYSEITGACEYLNRAIKDVMLDTAEDMEDYE